VLANGGGTQPFNENDPQIRGNSTAPGVDLNQDGDFLDAVTLYRPNTTNTRRYGLITSLIYDINDDHRLRGVYTYDYGRHRQTGDATFLDIEGDPLDVFGGKDGNGPQVRLPDGTNLRRRDRFSIASLNQFSAEYRGDFLDRRLRINAGVRLPYFERQLNNYCFQRDTFNALCTTQAGTPVPGRPGFFRFPVSALNNNANNIFGAPRSFEVEYNDLLPNLGVSYRFGESHQVYAAYAEGLSAPRTDDLYDQIPVNPEPETTQNFDIGYRYQTPRFNLSIGAFSNNFQNRIVRTFDEAAGLFLSRNIGEVELRGIDGEAGWRVTDDFTLYGSASYIDTEVLSDQPRGLGLAPLPTAGTQLVETPDFQAALRANYTLRDVNLFGVQFGNFEFGGQVKYVGDRFATDVNDEVAPSFTVVDLDIRWDLQSIGWDGSFLQLNVTNLFDEEYLGDISSGSNRFAVPGVTTSTQSAIYQVGAPATVMLTLRARFF